MTTPTPPERAPTRDSLLALIRATSAAEAIYIRASKQREPAAKRHYRAALDNLTTALDDLLDRAERAEREVARLTQFIADTPAAVLT